MLQGGGTRAAPAARPSRRLRLSRFGARRIAANSTPVVQGECINLEQVYRDLAIELRDSASRYENHNEEPEAEPRSRSRGQVPAHT